MLKLTVLFAVLLQSAAAPRLGGRSRARADVPGVRAACLPDREPWSGVQQVRAAPRSLGPARRCAASRCAVWRPAGRTYRRRARQQAAAQARAALRSLPDHRVPRRLPVPPARPRPRLRIRVATRGRPSPHPRRLRLTAPTNHPIRSSTVHRALICRETHTRMRVGSSNH